MQLLLLLIVLYVRGEYRVLGQVLVVFLQVLAGVGIARYCTYHIAVVYHPLWSQQA